VNAKKALFRAARRARCIKLGLCVQCLEPAAKHSDGTAFRRCVKHLVADRLRLMRAKQARTAREQDEGRTYESTTPDYQGDA